MSRCPSWRVTRRGGHGEFAAKGERGGEACELLSDHDRLGRWCLGVPHPTEEASCAATRLPARSSGVQVGSRRAGRRQSTLAMKRTMTGLGASLSL